MAIALPGPFLLVLAWWGVCLAACIVAALAQHMHPAYSMPVE